MTQIQIFVKQLWIPSKTIRWRICQLSNEPIVIYGLSINNGRTEKKFDRKFNTNKLRSRNFECVATGLIVGLVKYLVRISVLIITVGISSQLIDDN